jgi:hypothetical protein
MLRSCIRSLRRRITSTRSREGVEGLAGFDSIPVEKWTGHRWFVGLPVFSRHPSTMCCLFHEQPNGERHSQSHARALG